MTIFSSTILDQYIAPGASLFNTADISGLSQYDENSCHWVGYFMLNSIVQGRWKKPFKELANILQDPLSVEKQKEIIFPE